MLCSSEEDLGHHRIAWPQQTIANIPQVITRASLRSLLCLSPPLLNAHLPTLPLVACPLLLGANPPDFRAIPKHGHGPADA